MKGLAKLKEQTVTDGEPMPAKVIPLDERGFLIRHRNGDSDAFGNLVARYRLPVYSYLARCGVVDGDRDDLFQEIFIRIHRAAHQYRVDRPLHPWLFTIVANTVRTYHRRRRVRELVASQPISREPRDRSPNGERVAEAKQTVAWLEEEMRRLSPVQREVLVLACVESLPLREVAEALDIPLNTVKTHLRRARTTLVRKLARRHRSAGGEVHHE